ncbi:hypothetical protein CapIbe_017600 [Capra ibex]
MKLESELPAQGQRGNFISSVARKCEVVCSSPDSECEDQTDFSAEGEQGGHGCAGVHPRQRWICHAGHS